MNEDLETRLRENRYEASGMELDELKRRALQKSSRGARRRRSGSPRFVTSFLVVALMASGGSAVVASSSGSSSGGQPSASISQYEQIVAGERILPGNARLLAPTGCVSRKFFARVRGTNVTRVVFRLDGKRIAVRKKADSRGNYKVRINPRKMRIGVHRIVATVRFKKATKKKAQRFRVSFQRCARKLAAPRFTG